MQLPSGHDDVSRILDERVKPPSGEPWISGRAVAEVLLAAGYETYAAGGCVRDLLLNLPVHDIDLATKAHPEQVETVFRACNWHTIAVGKAFGVVVVVSPTGANIEVATFRTDGAYVDGRRPNSIHFSSAREDVERRDFTINALLYDLRRGEVIDHVGGRHDLIHGIIRAVGDPVARLHEDRLRVLRGLRFAARLGFEIEPATWSSLILTSLSGLSGERLMQELTKAITGPGRSRWLMLLRESGHLAGLCSPLAECTATDLTALAQSLELLVVEDPFFVRLAIWLSPLESGAARLWLEQQPLPTAVMRSTLWLLEYGRSLSALQALPLAARRRRWQHVDGRWLVRVVALLHRAPIQNEAVRTLKEEAQRDFDQVWTPLLRAKDLLALGLPPGPALGAVLRDLEDADLEGRFSDRSAAIVFARERIAVVRMASSKPSESDPGAR